MNDWDKILDDFARKCKGGAPDMTNPRHLALLRESLIKFGWKENATNAFIGNLREGKEIVTEDNPGVFFGYTKKNKKRYFDSAEKLKAAIGRGSVTPAPNQDAQDLANPDTERDAHDMQKPDSRGTEWDASYYGAEDSAEWEKHYREAEDNGDEEALAQIKWFGEKQGWGEGGELKKETATQKKSREAQEKHDEEQQKADEVHTELYGEDKEGQLIGGDTGPNDTDTKNDVIKYGYKGYEGETGKKPAPGNEGSAFNEILSGEGAEILEKYSDLSAQELTKILVKQFCGTALGQENSSGKPQAKATPDTPKGADKECYKKCSIAAQSAKRKHQRAQNIKDNLGPDGEGILGEETETTQFYGANESLDAQCEAIDNAETVLAPNGTEIPRESTWTPDAPIRNPGPPKEPYRDYHKRVQKWAKETGAKRTETGALDMAMEGGGGENPSDTATFIKDENGNLVIAFASDKMTTNDIQANSSIVNEINQKIQWVQDLPLSHFPGETDEEKQSNKDKTVAQLNTNKDEIDRIESQLKGNLGTVTDSMSDLDPQKVVTMLSEDKLHDGSDDPQTGRGGRGTKKHWEKTKKSYSGPYITTKGKISAKKRTQLYYLTQKEIEGDVPGYYPSKKKTNKNKAQYYSQNPPGDTDILDALLSKTKDSDPDRPLTEAEAKLVERLSRRMVDHYREMAKNAKRPEDKKAALEKAEEYNIAEKTEQVRREAVAANRRQLDELNKEEVTLPNGKKKPLGDYLEAQNLVDKLHLSQMDGEDAHGVYKYGGLMEVNMGGVVVNPEVLEKCLDSATSGEVIEDFEVDNPGPDEELSRSTDEFETDSDGNAWYWAEPGTGSHASDPNGTPTEGLDPLNMTTDEGKAKKNKSGKVMAVGRVTGRNIFIYAVTKSRKRIPIATKTLRSKTGKLGKFQTVYQWSSEIQECFKDNEDPKNEPVEKS